MRHPTGSNAATTPSHPVFSRRVALQAGAIGLLGLGMEHLEPLIQADAVDAAKPGTGRAQSVIYIFLSGGLAQHESFDPKPDAPEGIRGEFRAIATATPGFHICEHLPLLARRSHLWSLVRSLTHSSNDHSAGHMIMLSGRSELPAGFDPNRPGTGDWPSIAAVVGAMAVTRNNLPPAVVLPERLVHSTGRVIPGQFAGQMGSRREPWFIDASPFDPTAYGAYPEFEFDHQDRSRTPRRKRFQVPELTLPEGFAASRMTGRLDLLGHLDRPARATWSALGPPRPLQEPSDGRRSRCSWTLARPSCVPGRRA